MLNVLLIYREMIPSVRLCGDSQLSWLSEMGIIDYRSIPENKLSSKICGWADIVWMVRADSRQELRLARMWKEKGKYLIYAMDDDLLDIPDGLSSSEYYHRLEVKTCIADMVKMCDCFVSPSKKLLNIYASQHKKGIHIEEPALIAIQQSKAPGATLKIGFAGSLDRGKDIDNLLCTAITRLCKEYGEAIQVEFFGAHPKIVDLLNLTWYPYCNSYAAYQQKMLELNWDIALAPMPDTQFHSCKHYNKLIEYSGCGIAGVYSNVLPYRGAVQDGVTGLLCENSPDAWYAAIRALIVDTELRHKISKNCIERARGIYSLEQVSMSLWKSLENLKADESNREPIMGMHSILLQEKFRKIVPAVKRYGLRTPIIAVKKVIRIILSKQRHRKKLGGSRA